VTATRSNDPIPFHDGFVSELIGRSAFVDHDGERRYAGRISDFVVERPDDTFPRIDAMLVEDLFDKQIVDVDGRKVVRINDIEVARTADALRVVAADIGVAGLLRRLGAGKVLPGLIDRIPRALIAWDNVAPLHDLSPTQIQLSVSERRLSRLHPSELADIISDLSAQDAARVVGSLDDVTAADAFEHLEPDVQRSIIDDLGTERAADIIEEMDSDDAADLLGELTQERQDELLAEMDTETAEDLRELVAYGEDTAGGLMTTDYVWIYQHRTIEATIAKIREIAPETEFIYYLYVLDQAEVLLGVLSLRTLLLAKPDATIHTIMDHEIIAVRPGKMLGIVTVDDAIDAIIPERLKKKLPRFTKHGRRRRASAAT
jgi:hypothetical protein